MNIDDQAFAKTLFFNGVVGLGYYVICSRYKLLSKEVLKSQGALFALSTTIHSFLQPSQQKKELSLIDAIPIALITLSKAWTDITWKAQLLSTAILGGSQILISKSPIWHNTSPVGPKPPKDPLPLHKKKEKPLPQPQQVKPINCSKAFGKTSIEIRTEDILKLPVAAIVNAANTTLLGGGGIDGVIHRAAGPQLKDECEKLPEIRSGHRINTGEAAVTGSYNIQNNNPTIQYVVHTAGPTGRTPNKEKLLADAYRNSLIEAAKNGIRSIAFPAISVGIYGYPLQEAQDIAFTTVKEYVKQHPAQFDTIVFAYLESNHTHLVAAKNAWETIILADQI